MTDFFPLAHRRRLTLVHHRVHRENAEADYQLQLVTVNGEPARRDTLRAVHRDWNAGHEDVFEAVLRQYARLRRMHSAYRARWR